MRQQPLIVIIGPTASGKTAMGVELAKKHGGEIIAADSRTVFREMNIGTAKPSEGERSSIVHWGFDLVGPGQRFTAAAWKKYAHDKITDIRARGKLPVIVGGTGLYIDGLIFDYQYPEEPSREQRQLLEQMSLSELVEYCTNNNIELPENDKNKRHLMRAIVHKDIENKRRDSIIENTTVVGIATNPEQLRDRIALRTEHMFADGVVDEARLLGEKYGWNNEAMSGNIYPLIKSYLDGSVNLEQAKEAFMHRDWQLAKRQMTWFRRNPYISWGTPSDISKRVDLLLASG